MVARAAAGPTRSLQGVLLMKESWAACMTGSTPTTACALDAGFADKGDDCDDAEALNSPAADEVCDTIDNDCDGIADDGVPGVPCGLASPPNCLGTLTCKTPQGVHVGGCAAGWVA